MALTDDNTHEFWRQRYEQQRTPWDRGSINPALADWLDDGSITPPASVLVPGCGRGYEVSALAERGFDVTGADLSGLVLQELAARLDRQGLSAKLVEADLLDWEPDAPFDAIYEQTCLCAVLPRHWPDYEARLHRWLRPGGKLLALFMQSDKTDDPPFHCSLPDMRELFESGRWRWPQAEPKRIPHPRDVFEYAFILERL